MFPDDSGDRLTTTTACECVVRSTVKLQREEGSETREGGTEGRRQRGKHLDLMAARARVSGGDGGDFHSSGSPISAYVM